VRRHGPVWRQAPSLQLDRNTVRACSCWDALGPARTASALRSGSPSCCGPGSAGGSPL